MREFILKRFELGKTKYGHGVRVDMDTVTWGTPKNSWLEMAIEEYIDAIIYIAADYIRNFETSVRPDDNERILELACNPEYMLSDFHTMSIKTITNLIYMSTHRE